MAYGLASTVTLTRVTGKQHFSSDVVVGSALGWYLGRQIYRARHDPELGGAAWGNLRDDDTEEASAPRPHKHGLTLCAAGQLGVSGTGTAGGVRLRQNCVHGPEALDTNRVRAPRSRRRTRRAAQERSGRDLADLQSRLQEEFSYEFGLLDGGRQPDC